MSVVNAAAWALGRIGDLTAVEPLKRALKENRNSNTQETINEALENIEERGGVITNEAQAFYF